MTLALGTCGKTQLDEMLSLTFAFATMSSALAAGASPVVSDASLSELELETLRDMEDRERAFVAVSVAPPEEIPFDQDMIQDELNPSASSVGLEDPVAMLSDAELEHFRDVQDMQDMRELHHVYDAQDLEYLEDPALAWNARPRRPPKSVQNGVAGHPMAVQSKRRWRLLQAGLVILLLVAAIAALAALACWRHPGVQSPCGGPVTTLLAVLCFPWVLLCPINKGAHAKYAGKLMHLNADP